MASALALVSLRLYFGTTRPARLMALVAEVSVAASRASVEETASKLVEPF
jgi:hypothetical protein